MRRIQTLPRTGSLAVALALLATSALGTARAQTGEAPQTGLAPEGLAKYVPSEGLFFYAEFQGFGAYPDAWKQTAAHKIVHDTKTGAMLDEIVAQVAEKALAARPNRRLTGADVAALVRHGLERGMVLGFYNTSAAPSGKAGVIVIRDAFAEEIRPVVAKLLAETGLVGPGVKLVEKSGRRIALDPDDAESGWWIEADRDLVIAERIDPILAVIDGQKPGAAESPERRALVAADGGTRSGPRRSSTPPRRGRACSPSSTSRPSPWATYPRCPRGPRSSPPSRSTRPRATTPSSRPPAPPAARRRPNLSWSWRPRFARRPART